MNGLRQSILSLLMVVIQECQRNLQLVIVVYFVAKQLAGKFICIISRSKKLTEVCFLCLSVWSDKLAAAVSVYSSRIIAQGHVDVRE